MGWSLTSPTEGPETRAMPGGTARCFEEASPEVRPPNCRPHPGVTLASRMRAKSRTFTLTSKC